MQKVEAADVLRRLRKAMHLTAWRHARLVTALLEVAHEQKSTANTQPLALLLLSMNAKKSAHADQTFAMMLRHLTFALFAWFSVATSSAAGTTLDDFRHLILTGTWTEKWPDAAGTMESRTVTAEVWTRAMQTTLDATGHLHIPAREQPYYIDGPLVLKSGQKLTAEAKAEIRLKPGTNTCMVRNANVIGFADRPVPAETNPDTDMMNARSSRSCGLAAICSEGFPSISST